MIRPGLRHPLSTCLLLVAVSACTERSADESAAVDGKPVLGGTLVIAGSAELSGMNAFTASESYTQDFMLHALFLAMVRLDEKGNYQPLLARSWNWEGDTAIVFHLRNDVKWHDGRKTSAHDVAFTFDRVRDPATAFPNAADFQFWKSMTVADSFTVRFTLEPQVEPLLSWVFMPIMPKHLLESVAPAQLAQAPFNHQPVGNGPFRFVEYRANDRWVFEAILIFPRT
jgi:peptide/nickel transport system substrate-binding protein